MATTELSTGRSTVCDGRGDSVGQGRKLRDMDVVHICVAASSVPAYFMHIIMGAK